MDAMFEKKKSLHLQYCCNRLNTEQRCSDFACLPFTNLHAQIKKRGIIYYLTRQKVFLLQCHNAMKIDETKVQ